MYQRDQAVGCAVVPCGKSTYNEWREIAQQLGPWDRIGGCEFEVPPMRQGLDLEKQKAW